jgi:threonine aldolase
MMRLREFQIIFDQSIKEKLKCTSMVNPLTLCLTPGARLWQGLVAEGVSLKQYCSLFDSVSLCFSKGLSTPVGAVIIGSSNFIKKARHFKKCFGGGVRNPGILSAACLVALDQTLPQLSKSHIVAKEIASKAMGLGYRFTLPVDTNMVFLDLEALGVSAKIFQQYCAIEGVAVLESNRIAVHHQISPEGVARLLAALTSLIRDVKAGTVKAGTVKAGTVKAD